MKKALKLLPALALCLCIVFALAACKNKDNDDDGKDDGGGTTPPACEHIDADDNGKCDKCEADFTDGDEPCTHIPGEPVRENEVAATCTAEGSYDEVVYCTVPGCGAEISRTAKTVISLGHDYESYVCTRCGASLTPSEGLAFTSNGDETCYVSGIGECQDTDIVIPMVSPDGDAVIGIGDDAFYGCTGLTSVVIPDSVTGIGNEAFYYCTGLTSITIPDSVTSIGEYAFLDCTGLTSVTIGNGVKSIGSRAFSYCTGLTSIDIPDSVTSIGSYAFSVCTGLRSITVDTDNTAYKSIDGNLYTKDGKTLVQYALGKTDSSFTIPDGVTSIGSYAFSVCTGLTSIVIPDSVKSIGSSAFSHCTGLTSIDIPDSVKSIGERAFFYCTGLVSVVIPDSVKSIGDDAFYYCTSLTIYCEAASKPSGWSSSWNDSDCPVVWGYSE